MALNYSKQQQQQQQKKKKKKHAKKKRKKNTTTNADLSAYMYIIRKRLTFGRTGEINHAMTKALLAFRRKSKSLHTQRERAP